MHSVDNWHGFDSLESLFLLDLLYRQKWPDHINILLQELSSLLAISSALLDIPELEQLARKLMHRIASYPECHPDVLHMLTGESDINVLVRVAENPNTSPYTLEKLSSHECHDVRTAIAENHHTPVDVLMRLSKDENADVRYCLAENHNIAQDILQLLVEDENCFVAHRARRTLNRLAPIQTLPANFRRQSFAARLLRSASSGL